MQMQLSLAFLTAMDAMLGKRQQLLLEPVYHNIFRTTSTSSLWIPTIVWYRRLLGHIKQYARHSISSSLKLVGMSNMFRKGTS